MGFIGLLILLFIGLFAFSQEVKDTVIDDDELRNYTIEQLLDLSINVKVSSSEGDVVFKTPSSTTIISRQQIESFNFGRVSEMLEVVAGVHIGRGFLKRNVTTIRGVLQDNYSNKVLILVNGVPSWNAATGEGCIDMIGIKDIERVEVLKGPASVLYGTNAYAGAVNIITRSYNKLSGEMDVSSGSYSSYGLGGNVGYGNDDLNVFAAVNVEDSEGAGYMFTDETGRTERVTEYVNTNNILINAKYKKHSFLANGYAVDESFLGPVPKFSSGAGNPHYVRGGLLAYAFEHKFSDRIKLNTGLSVDFAHRNFSRTEIDTIRCNLRAMRFASYLKMKYQFNKWLSAEIQVASDNRHCFEYKNYNTKTGNIQDMMWAEADTLLSGNNGMSDLYLRECSGLCQLRADFEKFALTIGGRHTANSKYGQDVSVRMSSIYSFSEKNSLKLIYGHSFRAPVFFETNFYYFTVMGNPDLKPEKSYSFELAYLCSFSSFYANAVFFLVKYDNNIYRKKQYMDINGHSIWLNRYENGGITHALGSELELKYVKPNFSTFVNYAFVQGDDAGYEFNYKYVPKHSMSAGASVKMSPQLQTSVVLNSFSGTEGVREPIPAQYYADADISYRHRYGNLRLHHSLAVNNITDQQIEYPEFSRRRVVNSLSAGLHTSVTYTFKVQF